MRDRKKKKKSNVDDEPPTNTTPEANEAIKDTKVSSKSRSRSRGRRSLSALFRKSASRHEGEDGDNTMANDSEAKGGATYDINPRVDPRGHLQGMTVREALLYNRERGRSPNRRAMKLAKTVLTDASNKSTTASSLSSSVPHSLDQIDGPKQVDTVHAPSDIKGGMTLPRVKSRGRSEGKLSSSRKTSGNSDTEQLIVHDKTNKMLPLDKRKYLIHQRSNDAIGDRSDSEFLHGDEQSALLMHSSPISSVLNDRRRDSYSQFLLLRDTKTPHHSVSPASQTEPILPSNTLQSLPHINVSKSSTIDSLAHGEERFDVFAQVHNDRSHSVDSSQLNLSNVDNKPKAVDSDSKSRVTDDVTEQPAKTVASPVETARPRRSSYVSPRRFSRASRPSETSNTSGISETSFQPIAHSPNELTAQVNNAMEVPKGKYQRQFSRDSRKYTTSGPDQVTKTMVDKETNTEGAMYATSLVESATQTSLTVHNTTAVETQTDMDNFAEHEDAELISYHEQGMTREVAGNLSNLQRDVVVVGQGKDATGLARQSLDSVFKPIKISKPRKATDICPDDNTIEVIEAHGEESGSDKIKRKSSKRKSKKSKEKKNNSTKSKKKSKSEERSNEHDDNVMRGRERGKSKTSSDMTYSDNGNGDSITNDPENDEVFLERKQSSSDKRRQSKEEKPKKQKRSRSIFRKTSKEHHDKSVATRKVVRAASLSEVVFDSSEDITKERMQQKSILRRGKRARSVGNVKHDGENKRTEFEESIKDLKESNDKEGKKESADKKKQPKMSLLAVVAMKAKISRFRKRKQEQKERAEMAAEVRDDETETKVAAEVTGSDNVPASEQSAENQQTNQTNVDSEDLNVAKVFYENEINTSIGKSTNSLEIIDDNADKEVKDIVYEKRLQFATPYCDDTMSEEELIKQRQHNTRLTSRRGSKVRLRQKKVISCCKKFVAFLFSHIGLCSLVVAYCILGGVIFKELEGAHEIQKKREITVLRQNFTEMIHRLAFETTLTKGNRAVFKTEVNAILKNFSVIIHKQTKEAGWDGQEVREVGGNSSNGGIIEPEQWSYPSSLLYAITVMTTIGYGHVAPKTDEGRIMTIAYAVLGIPLTLLCLTNIGDVMAHGFRMLYGKVCCGVCCILFRPRRRRRLDPEKGIPADRMLMQEDEKSAEVIQVPTSVCLLLMTTYIMLGTIMFSYWEEWDMVTGTYFCFITLSTIGFGDVVPGMSQKEWNQHEKLVSCALYLVLGLSLIAMCFNLVQEDVKAKCKWLGMKLGIIDKPVSSV